MNPAFFSNYENRKASPRYNSEQEEQQQPQVQPVKTEVVDSSHGPDASTSNAITSSQTPYNYSKLDGVLYHFYSKTLAVITNCRLTHYDAGVTDSSSQSTSSTPIVESSTSSSKRRPNKWFELEVADYDIFREEVRFWRNISTMIPSTVLEGPSSTKVIVEPCYVPPMILDIILDTSSMSDKHILTMEHSSAGLNQRRKRSRVDGKDSNDSSRRDSTDRSKVENQSVELASRPNKPIVLESWKVEMGVCNPADAPDLPIFYRQATAHLKEVYSLAKQLPAASMFLRLQKGKDMVKKADSEAVSDVELLRMGVRLGAGKLEDGEKDDGICELRESLGPLVASDEGKPKVTETFNFQPLVTAIGIIQCSVEYRIDSDFYVEDMDVVMNMRDLDLDEDYFRPSAHSQIKLGDADSAIPTFSSTSATQDDIPQSLLSTTAIRRQSIMTSPGMSLVNEGKTTAATPSPPSESPLRSSGPGLVPSASTSVFSTQNTSGRPVAGLASLRRSPSITAHGSSPTTTMTPIGGTGTSTASTTTVSGTDAAFLTHGRRTSTTERRLRTLNTLSGSTDKNSPPPSSALSTTPSSRPILARTSASAIPYGSFSPSSPSPLAQQLLAQQQPMSSQSSYRMSSSPSYRNTSLPPLSASPNLRSVFQFHNPSHSQNSISSLSRTPPRFMTDGSSVTNPSSSLGLQTTMASQGSHSQLSLAEGRKPSVAPQMIKRYSSTFNYRQGRRASSGITGSSIESDIGNSSAPYSKSWQARIEQRQMFTARSLGREDGSHFSTGGNGTGGASFTSSYSPQAQRQSNSQEEDLDDFVRMIDSNHPVEASSSSVGQSGSINLVENLTNQKTGAASHYTIASSGVGFTRQYGWNRNQVDEMLNKMQNSVREFSTSSTSRGSEASVGANSSSGGSGRSAGMLGGSDSNSPINQQGLPLIQSVSPSFVRSPLSKVGFSAASTSSAMRVPDNRDKPTSVSIRNSLQAADRPSFAYRYNLPARRNLHTETNSLRAEDSNLTSSDVREGSAEDLLQDDPKSRRARRTTSGGSLEMYANQPHSYDPLEDEAVGRLELLQDDLSTLEQEGQGTSGVPIMGGGGHHHHHHHHTHHQHHDTATSEAAERRRADIELARNFGQVVSSSSNRGNPRASLSPWRNRIHSRNNNRGNGGSNNGNGSAGLHTT